MRPRLGTTVPSQRRATLCRPLLAPRPVFRIPENRKVLEVTRDAALEVVAVPRPTFAFALNERQVAPAPAAAAALRPLALEPPPQPRPFSADDESDGAGDQHDRNDSH